MNETESIMRFYDDSTRDPDVIPRRVALVTGPQGNLGPIWCETLKELGYEVEGWGWPTVDLVSREAVRREWRKYVHKYTGIPPSVIVNNAAIDNPPGSPATFFGNIDTILRTNLQVPCWIAETFIPGMIENGGGIIVNIGSIMGNIGADWRNYAEGWEKPVGYNLSKAALVQLSRSITTQYGRHNIRSVTIAFGPYDGGKLSQDFLGKFLKNVPLGRTISRESFKAAMRFAITCPEAAGQQFLIDGGYTAL